ncbi:MAG: FixH family protein [Bacteroidetes bacterium]|nr:FixH family protein [Bacteroidota bacterium]MBL0259208.1 FixH family protein [Bacteroidota bacterium]MBP6402373.1 FixH family protein [Bacteroidia bacterium]MBP6648803.1 FixH family protein [Bacteroidia bacterium]
MKFNWGWGITLFLVVFMSFILQLVYRCTQQRVDLVSEKYYENEIKYQQRIDMEKNTASLIEDLNIQTKNGLMEINYPSLSGVRTGKITFFKPDDSRIDFVVPVDSTSGILSQKVDITQMKKGWWNVQVQWNQEGTPFYSEKKVLID